MEAPLISIIVPVYNVESYLPRCLESLVNQSYTNLQILLINDGSIDNSGEICENYKLKDKRIEVFHLENGGVSRARNIGYSKAKGEYIGFVDSDDWIDLTMYENLLNSLIENNADMSVCDFYYEYGSRTITHKEFSKSEKLLLNRDDLYEIVLNPKYFGGYVINKLFKKSLFIELFGEEHIFDEDIHYCEDLLLTCIYINKCTQAVFLTKPKYHYSQRLDSATSDFSFNPKIVSLISAYEQILAIYKRENINKLINRVRLNYIKININIRNRIIVNNGDRTILSRIKYNINNNLLEILRARDVRVQTKANLLISYFMPRLSRYLKFFVKKIIRL